MLIAAVTFWWVFMNTSAGAPYTLVGPFSTKSDCEFVQRQLAKELQPKKAACIEAPTQHQ